MLLCAGLAAACQSDLDCSLNGLCRSGACDCDAAWEGLQCERFATLPTPAGMDIKEANVTTWGGGPLQRKVDGEFQMFVSEYVRHIRLFVCFLIWPPSDVPESLSPPAT